MKKNHGGIIGAVRGCGLAVVIGVLAGPQHLHAASYTWGAFSSGNWGQASNWGSTATPGATDTANVGDSTTNLTITIADGSGADISQSVGTLNVDTAKANTTINGISSGTATLYLDNGAGNATIGANMNSGKLLTFNVSVTLNSTVLVNSLGSSADSVVFAGGIKSGNSSAGLIIGAATGSSTAAASPVLIKTTAATYLGSTVINGSANATSTAGGGKLEIGGNNMLPSGTVMEIDPSSLASNSQGGSFILNGFNQTIAGLTGTSGTAVGTIVDNTSTSSTLTINTASGASYAFAGSIQDTNNSGTGKVSLLKSGSGTQTLSGNNTYSGTTQVSGGNLVITGTATSTAFTVASSGILSGTGKAGNSVDAKSGSFLAPGVNTSGAVGNSGTLTVAGGLTLETGANLDYDLSSSGLSGNDQIVATGVLTIGTALTVNYNQLNGSLDTANKYQLITFTGTAPSLSGVTFTTTGASGYNAAYSIDSGGLALDVAFSASGGSTPAAAFFNGQGTDVGTFGNFDTDVSSGTAVSAALGNTTNVSFNANRNTTVSTTTLNSGLDINSVTFGTGSGINSGMTINGTGTLTVEATTAGGNSIGNGITVNTGGGNNAINTAVALGNDQTWTVTDSTSTLTVGGTVSGSHKLTTAGNGVVQLSGANSYSGGTSVSSGMLLLSNTSGSATGTGSLTVSAGATLAGYGSSSGTGFAIGAASAARTSVLVGMNSASDTNTTHSLTLIGSGASTITNATLQFNISAATPSQGTQLDVGATAITFSNTTLALNVQGTGVIPSYSPYVLIAGTGNGQYSGLTTQLETIGGTTYDVITGGLGLSFSPSLANTWYANNSFLYLNTAGGVDDIEVAVVPEPGTWALMLGGLSLLLLWQRRKNLRS